MYEILPGVSLSRITPPTVPPQFILRKSILELLEKPAPLAVFAIAPSGFGKTILAAQWAAMHPERTIWYTPALTDTFKDLVFHCVSSLRRFKPDAAPWIEKYRSQEFDPRTAVVEFANEIATFGSTVHFITDGAHNINPINEEFTQLWAELAPENLKTLTIRNNLPTINYSRAIAIDAFHMLKPIDLALTEDEIQVLSDNYGIDYLANQNQISKVQNWPAGVLMTLKTLSKTGNAVNSEFQDSKMLIAATLDNLEPSIYSILEKLVYFENLSQEQARLALSTPGQYQSFLRLTSEGIFVLPIGSSGEEFAINELIKGAIVAKLKSNPARSHELISNTVEILIKTKRLAEAINHLEEIGEANRAGELVGLHVRRLLWDNDIDGMLKSIEMISKYLGIGSIGPDLLKASLAMACGSLDELSVKIKVLEQAATSSGDLKNISGDLLTMKTRLAFGSGDLTKAIAINLAPDVNHESLFALRMAANAAFLMEDIEKLEKLVAIAKTLPPPDVSEVSIHLPSMEALLALAEGKLRDALDTARFVIEATKEMGATGIWLPYDMVYCAAEVMREFGEENNAIALLEWYKGDAKKFFMSPWLAAFEAKQALIECQVGRSTAALQRIRKVREELESPNLSLEVFRIVDEHELIIRSLLRDFERMGEIAYRTPSTPTVSVVTAVLEIRKGGELAKNALTSLQQRTPREKLLFHILQVNLNLEKPKVAGEHMQKLLAIVMNHGFRQILLIQGPKFQEYLLKYAASHPTVYMEQIARLLREQMANTNSKSDKLENPLTKREIEILNRLSTGLPISQIASNLHISNNTIKTHLKNVYKKLGAESREDAVSKGRELLLF